MKPAFRVRQLQQQTGKATSDFPVSRFLSDFVPVRVASAGRPARLVYRRVPKGQTYSAPAKKQYISCLLREGLYVVADFILGADLLAVVDLVRRL